MLDELQIKFVDLRLASVYMVYAGVRSMDFFFSKCISERFFLLYFILLRWL